MKQFLSLMTALAFFTLGSACSPEVGSDAWCEAQKQKPKNQWTAQDTADYTKYCILKMDPRKQ